MLGKKWHFKERAGALALAAVIAWGTIQAPGLTMSTQAAGPENVAKGIIPASEWVDGSEMVYGADGETDNNSAVRATDGKADASDAVFRYGQTLGEEPAKPSFAQFDLKKIYDINSVKMWRYYADGREYTPTVIAVSDSKEDWNSENTEVIYNSDQENIYGFGAGTDEGYAETAEGREFSCDTPVTGQYVRIYSCGSNINQGNHLVEFEVYGTVHGQVPGKVSVTVNEGEHFSVIAEEGSESPMEPGADYSFKVQAKSGYYVSSVTVNESVLEPEDGIYTIRDVQEDQTVNVQVLPYPDAENLALKKPVEVRYTADG